MFTPKGAAAAALEIGGNVHKRFAKNSELEDAEKDDGVHIEEGDDEGDLRRDAEMGLRMSRSFLSSLAANVAQTTKRTFSDFNVAELKRQREHVVDALICLACCASPCAALAIVVALAYQNGSPIFYFAYFPSHGVRLTGRYHKFMLSYATGALRHAGVLLNGERLLGFGKGEVRINDTRSWPPGSAHPGSNHMGFPAAQWAALQARFPGWAMTSTFHTDFPNGHADGRVVLCAAGELVMVVAEPVDGGNFQLRPFVMKAGDVFYFKGSAGSVLLHAALVPPTCWSAWAVFDVQVCS